MTSEEIIAKLPYRHPFLFVDEILEVDENGISGTYTYKASSDFYKGHFKNRPVTPGVILTETMAQIGLVAFGIFLLKMSEDPSGETKIALSSCKMDFYKPVLPSEKVLVKSVKEYFRFNKLKCSVEMYDQADDLVCRGTIAGMVDL